MVAAYLVLLMWTVPTTREDGSALDARSISHYVLYRNGEEWFSTTAKSYDADRQGNYCVRVIDDSGNTSDCSNSLHIRVKGKKR